jgi:two-component system, NarL family, nitrate/nitrite response regulator NarL
MERAVTTAVVEDHPVVIEGIGSWIAADPGRRVRLAHIACDLAGLDSAVGPPADVIILDLELGGRLITDEISALTAAGHRIVVFSGHSDPAIVTAVLDAGAYAYVAKDEGRDHLVQAVLAAADDRPYVTRSQAKAMLTDTRPLRPVLSAQERQALLLWFQGMSKQSVGRRMSISENTVRQYINRARMKYASAGRAAPSKDALLARAIEDQIITPGEVAMYTSRARQSAPAVSP